MAGGSTSDKDHWHQLGEAARLAHEAVNDAFRQRLREADPDRYSALIYEFRAKNAAALPSTHRGFLRSLAAGDSNAIEAAIAFLEADPWFFRSGYEKQNLIRHLKRTTLTGMQRGRLGCVVLAAIDGRDRREFRHYCRLACAVWSDLLDEEVALRMVSADAGVRRRAVWVAQAAISSGKA